MSSKFSWPLSLPPSLAGAVLLQSFPLPAGKLHIPETWNETLEFGKGRGRVSLVFTRPPTLPEPCPQLRKASWKCPLYHFPSRAGGWERAVPSAPGSRCCPERSLAGALRRRPQTAAPGLTAPSHAERSSPHHDVPRCPPRAFADLAMRVLGGLCGALLAGLALVLSVSEANCE